MIVLDVCLGLTKTEVGKVLDQNVCHVFAPDRSSLQKSKASLLLEERVPLFHWDCGQRPAWGWWWIHWQSGRTGPCLPSSRQSQHLPGIESSKSEEEEKWTKIIPHQFKRWQVWLWCWCKSRRSSHVASAILAEIRFKRSRGGEKRSKGYRGKKICHVFSTRLDKADVPKVGAKDQSVNVRLRCKTGT